MRSICNSCVSIHNKKYANTHKKKISEYHKNYRATHKEKLYSYNKRMKKQWDIDNREKILLYRVRANYKRRPIQSETYNRVTTQQLNKLVEESNNICFWCNEEIKILNFDHIYPLSKGGRDKINNIVVSCSRCNQRKHNKDPEVWLNEVNNIKEIIRLEK